MTFGRIVRRSLLYVGLAVASLAIFSLVVVLGVRAHISVPFQWIWLVIFTGGLTYAIVKKPSRAYWTKISFWVVCAGVLAVHLSGFIYLIGLYPEFKPVWYVPIVMFEAGVFGVLCELILGRSRKRSARP
jgi:hypothetical protein